MKTRGLNYRTIYRYNLKDNDSYDISSICFARLFKETESYRDNIQSGYLKVKIFIENNYNKKFFDNYCILSTTEIKEYLKWLRSITKLSFKQLRNGNIEPELNDSKFKIICVTLEDSTPYVARLSATMIRNMYEMAYQIPLKLAFLMNNIEEFSNLDFTEKYCIAINSIKGYGTGHSMYESRGTKFYNNKSIRKRYLKASKSEKNVNQFMEDDENYCLKLKKEYWNKVEEDENGNEISYFNFLEENTITDEFKEILLYNYNLMKDYEQ